jgi:hypothetical protein
MNAALSILKHFPDPESRERAIARAMLRGPSSADLNAAARDLAHALGMTPSRARDAAVAWTRDAFLAAGEEVGAVPLEGPAVGERLYQ